MDRLAALRTLAGYCVDATVEIWRGDNVDGWAPASARFVMILLAWVVGFAVALFILVGADPPGDFEDALGEHAER